ncbi:MAG: hypothetical protein JXQ29_09850 [Planctomycetes bacterium]|nr:hypothetical protein [Planctomycetota bacterium]
MIHRSRAGGCTPAVLSLACRAVLSAVLSAGLAAIAVPAAAGGFEPLRPDYTNVRGVNYIRHVNPIGMWRFYDDEQYDRELADLKDLGLNSLRVWLAWPVYDVEGTGFIAKFTRFLTLCEKHGLRVMPVLWDGFGSEPSRGYDDLTEWVMSPGFALATAPSFKARARAYTTAVVEAGMKSPALLMWDIMNEPDPALLEDFVREQAELVERLDPAHPVTVSHARAPINARTVAWVDVLSYHPYGMLRRNVTFDTTVVRQLAATSGNKPVLITEFGMPGVAQNYADTLRFITDEGVGFFVFDAIIGIHQLRALSGLLYPDGTGRDEAALLALQAVARAQGVNVTRRFAIKGPADPAYVAQRPMPVGIGVWEVCDLLLTWEKDTGKLEWATLYEQALISLWFSFVAAELVSSEEAYRADELRRQMLAAAQRNDEPTFHERLNALVAMSAAMLEQRAWNAHAAFRRGASSSVPAGWPRPQLTARGTAEATAIQLIAYGCTPRSMGVVIFGLSPADLPVAAPGGTLLLNVKDYVHFDLAVADRRGVIRYTFDAGPLQHRGATLHVQIATNDGSDHIQGTNALRLEIP